MTNLDELSKEEIQKLFKTQSENVKNAKSASDEDKLYLYKYYKQATEGDINYSKPRGIFNIVAVKKWEEWNSLKGVTQDKAKTIYTEFVNKLEIKYKK